jgi:hypothetical protein
MRMSSESKWRVSGNFRHFSQNVSDVSEEPAASKQAYRLSSVSVPPCSLSSCERPSCRRDEGGMSCVFN